MYCADMIYVLYVSHPVTHPALQLQRKGMRIKTNYDWCHKYKCVDRKHHYEMAISSRLGYHPTRHSILNKIYNNFHTNLQNVLEFIREVVWLFPLRRLQFENLHKMQWVSSENNLNLATRLLAHWQLSHPRKSLTSAIWIRMFCRQVSFGVRNIEYYANGGSTDQAIAFQLHSVLGRIICLYGSTMLSLKVSMLAPQILSHKRNAFMQTREEVSSSESSSLIWFFNKQSHATKETASWFIFKCHSPLLESEQRVWLESSRLRTDGTGVWKYYFHSYTFFC